jgi:ribosomal protein L13E
MSAHARKKQKSQAKTKKTSGRNKPKVAKVKQVKKKVPAKEKPKKAAKPKNTEKKENAPAKVVVKMGPPPSAGVSVRHLDSMQGRPARGFSFGELSSAGIRIETAKRGELSVDVRRRSVVDGNVEMLKGWVKGAQRSAAPEKAIEVAPATGTA